MWSKKWFGFKNGPGCGPKWYFFGLLILGLDVGKIMVTFLIFGS